MHSAGGQRAQGTIEYLVIIGIVVILALAVVGIILGTSGLSTKQITSSSSDIKTNTAIVSLYESAIGTLTSGSDANGILTIQNNSGDIISALTITLDGKDHDFTTTLPSGDVKNFKLIDVATPCQTGQTTTNQTVIITFTNQYSVTKSVNLGTVALTCAPAVNPTGNNIIGEGDSGNEEDTTPPVITLSSPAASATVTSTDTNIAFTFTADETTTTCTLYIKTGSTWYFADTNTTSYAGGTVKTIDANLSLYGVGNHYWDINCLDTSNNLGTATDRNIAFALNDTTPPVITLTAPAANATVTTSDTNTAFTFTADETTTTCTLYIKTGSTWYFADTNTTSYAAGIVKTIDANLSLFGSGDHNWDVNCLDTSNNTGTATDRNINYTQAGGGGGGGCGVGESDLYGTCYSGAIAYYPFDGNVEDALGNYDGTNNGATLNADGEYGSGSYFFNTGQNDSVTASIPQFTEYTISMWVKFTDSGHNAFITRDSGGGGYLFVGSGAHYPYANIHGCNTASDASQVIDDNAWHYLAMTYGNGTGSNKIILYVDGNEVANTSATCTDQSNQIAIGKDGTGSSATKNIDEVILFNRDLNADEIAQLYNDSYVAQGCGAGETDLYGTCYDGVLAYYPFDTDASDSTGTYDGTAVGSPSLVAAKVNDGYQLDGSSQSIDIDNLATALHDADDVSIAFWFKKTNSGSKIVWSGKGPCGGDYIYLLSNGGFNIPLGGDGSIDSSAGAYSNDTWNYVVLTVTPGGTSHLYLNGNNEIASGSLLAVSNNCGSGGMHIGVYQGPQWSFAFGGIVDEFVFFDRAISTTEVTALYNATN